MSTTFGTIAGGTYSVTLGTNEGSRPQGSPKGLIVTQAVQTKAGWFGQVFVDKAIVFESETPRDDSDAAIKEANEQVVAAVTKLFTT